MYPLLGHFVFRSKRPEANAQEVFASASLLVTFTGTSPPPLVYTRSYWVSQKVVSLFQSLGDPISFCISVPVIREANSHVLSASARFTGLKTCCRVVYKAFTTHRTEGSAWHYRY